VAEAAGAQVTTLEAMAQLGFHYAIDTTGNDQMIAALVETIGGCGTLALVGIGRPAAVIDPVKLVEREITLVGCDPFGAEPVEVVALAAHLDAFIAEQIPLEAVPDAYARHLAGHVDGLKTIILCGQIHGPKPYRFCWKARSRHRCVREEVREQPFAVVEREGQAHGGLGTVGHEETQRSYAVDEDIQRPLQRVAMLGQRSHAVAQFPCQHGSQFRNPDDPALAVQFYRWGQPRKPGIAASLPQRGHDAGSLDPDQVGLQIDDEKPICQTVKIKLCQAEAPSKAAERRKGQAIPGDFFCIGRYGRLIFRTPQTVALNLRSLGYRGLREARHVQAKRPCSLRHIGIQCQIDFDPSHPNLLEYAYERGV
jgi:hypothetical protein